MTSRQGSCEERNRSLLARLALLIPQNGRSGLIERRRLNAAVAMRGGLWIFRRMT